MNIQFLKKLMNIQVSNLISDSGNNIANQFSITTNKGRYFQSYETMIAFVPYHGLVQLDSNYWNYSRTTSKYRNKFLGLTTDQTKKQIADGTIKLTNLNKYHDNDKF
tara:strand:+ start:103 stop:423 length:321 start_codon:yes stop_codon:yes gene_type:complete